MGQYDAAAVDLQLNHVRDASGVAGALQRLIDPRAVGGVEAPRTVIEFRLDQLYSAVHGASIERHQLRGDLREIAQHLDAACRERLTASNDRAEAARDRAAARSDRDHARTARQQASLDRAAVL